MTSIRWPSRSTASTRCSYPLVVVAKPPGNKPSILDNAGLPKTHVHRDDSRQAGRSSFPIQETPQLAMIEYSQDACQKHGRGRWTAGNIGINRNYRIDAAGYGGACGENSATASAGANCDDKLRRRSGFIGSFHCLGHIKRYGSGYEQHVGMLGGGNEVNPETLQILVRVGKRADFCLAAVARAAINLADVQCAAHDCSNLSCGSS